MMISEASAAAKKKSLEFCELKLIEWMKAETKFIVCLVLNVCIFISKFISTFSCNFSIKNTQIYNAGMSEEQQRIEFRLLQRQFNQCISFLSHCDHLYWIFEIPFNCQIVEHTHTHSAKSAECSTISDGLIFWWRVKNSWHIFLVADDWIEIVTKLMNCISIQS